MVRLWPCLYSCFLLHIFPLSSPFSSLFLFLVLIFLHNPSTLPRLRSEEAGTGVRLCGIGSLAIMILLLLQGSAAPARDTDVSPVWICQQVLLCNLSPSLLRWWKLILPSYDTNCPVTSWTILLIKYLKYKLEMHYVLQKKCRCVWTLIFNLFTELWYLYSG